MTRRYQTPAPAVPPVPSPQPERGPCPACGHWGPRYVLCADPACQHGDVTHELNDDGTRGRCTRREGAGNKKCPCKTFIDPNTTETPQ